MILFCVWIWICLYRLISAQFQFKFISAFSTFSLKTRTISKVGENFPGKFSFFAKISLLWNSAAAHFFYWLLNSFHHNRLGSDTSLLLLPQQEPTFYKAATKAYHPINFWSRSLSLSLTLSGCSWGASSLSLFRHLSISVNLPVFPVAWASAYTTSWKENSF